VACGSSHPNHCWKQDCLMPLGSCTLSSGHRLQGLSLSRTHWRGMWIFSPQSASPHCRRFVHTLAARRKVPWRSFCMAVLKSIGPGISRAAAFLRSWRNFRTSNPPSVCDSFASQMGQGTGEHGSMESWDCLLHAFVTHGIIYQMQSKREVGLR